MDLIKELIVTSKHTGARFSNGILSRHLGLSQLYEDGLVLRRSVLTRAQAQDLRQEIDRLLLSDSVNVWRDSHNSDERIYGIDAVSELVRKILPVEEFRAIGESYLKTKLRAHFILAGRLNFVEGNEGSGGGWHRDSPFTHQFKAITYLSDVKPQNGPFQYLLGSHSGFNKFNLPFRLGQYRFKNAEIDSLMNIDLLECTGEAGDVCLTDTKGIHRGKPIEADKRYALTVYFFEKEKQLKKFQSYLQK